MKLSEMPSGDNTQHSEKKRSANETYEQLKGLSQDELMQRLVSEINEQKSQGKFDYDGLKNAIDKVSLYLPKQTYENILRILENFK